MTFPLLPPLQHQVGRLVNSVQPKERWTLCFGLPDRDRTRIPVPANYEVFDVTRGQDRVTKMKLYGDVSAFAHLDLGPTLPIYRLDEMGTYEVRDYPDGYAANGKYNLVIRLSWPRHLVMQKTPEQEWYVVIRTFSSPSLLTFR